MSDFLTVLTHGRRLQSAVKALSVEELESVISKLNTILDKKQLEKQAEIKAAQEKQAKLAEIKQQMIEAGIDVSDLQEIETKTKLKSVGKKRPIKYSITVEGKTTRWTGVGRMPVVFKQALEKGSSLGEFKV